MAEADDKKLFLEWAKRSDIVRDMYARINNIADELEVRDQVPRLNQESTSHEIEFAARELWAAAKRKRILPKLMEELEKRYAK